MQPTWAAALSELLRYPRCIPLPAMLAMALTGWQAWPANAAETPTLSADTSAPNMSLFIPGQPVEITFKATGLAGAPADVKLAVTVTDEHDARIAATEMSVTPDAAGAWVGSYAAPAGRLGFYRVYARLSNGIELAKLGSRHAGYLTYAVVPDPAKRILYPEDDTRFGMQGGFNASVNVKPYLGIRWVLGGYTWSQMEPDRAGQFIEQRKAAAAQGKSFPERLTEEYNGKPWTLYTLPCLYSAPKWAALPGTAGSGAAALNPQGETAWDAYCRAVATAFPKDYPDRKEHLYQITWEPVYPWGFKGTTEQLIRIYQIAYKAIHETDPHAVVIGPTGAGLSAGDVAWNTGLFAKGLGRYIDGFSIHPYCPVPPEPAGVIDRIREIKEMIHQSTGKDLPEFGTEQGNATGEDPAKELGQARGLIRQNLIMLGEGYRFNFAFYIADYPGEPGYGYFYNLNPRISFGTDKIGPKPVAAAYAAQSFLLEGHRSAGPIEYLGDTTLGYVFEQPGDVTLALWDYGDKPHPCSLAVGAGPGVTVYDWMGNIMPVKPVAGTLSLTLGPEPIYVKGVSPLLWGSTAFKPVRPRNARLDVFPGSNAALSLTIAAEPGKPLVGRVVAAPDGRLGAPDEARTVSLKPGQSAPLTFHLHIPVGAPLGAYSIRFTLQGDQGPLFSTGMMAHVRPPVAVTSVVPVWLGPAQAKSGARGGPWGLRISLEDRVGAADTLTVTARLQGVPESQAAATVALPARSAVNAIVRLPNMDISAIRLYTAALSVKCKGSGYQYEATDPVNFTAAAHVAAPLALAATAGGWDNLPALPIQGRASLVRSPDLYRGASDLGAVARYGWDSQALYLEYDVTDDVFVQDKTGFDTWKGDCIQLGFNLDPGASQELTGNNVADSAIRRRYSEIDLALTHNGPEAYRTVSGDPDRMPVGALSAVRLQLSIVRRPGGLLYQARIPWSTLGTDKPPTAGQAIGIAAAVNDMDSAEQLDPKAVGLFGGITPSKDPTLFGRLVLAPGSAANPETGTPGVRLSGILGQSQQAGSSPAPFLGASGVAVDRTGAIWTANGTEIYRFSRSRGGAWTQSTVIPCPSGVSFSNGLRSDGARIFFMDFDRKVYTLDPEDPGPPALFCTLAEAPRSFAVSPDGLKTGWAARAKLFSLHGDAVSAYDADGKPLGTILTLPHPAGATWPYCALGIEPHTGDLLVGSYYPDMRIYRFDPAGQPITRNGWPRPGFADQIVDIDGTAWELDDSGAAAALPEAPTPNPASIPAAWTKPISGLALTPSGYVAACAQGLVTFNREGDPGQARIGGIPGVDFLACAPDGAVVAGEENGQRMVRLSIDDAPNAAFQCNANEPWRIGAGWKDHAVGAAWDGASFLVLDTTSKQLWSFDPWHTGWQEKPWIARTPENSFTSPRALAVGDVRAWVLDGSRLLESTGVYNSTPQAPPVFQPARLPAGVSMADVISLAALGDDMLFTATATRIQAWRRTADGAYIAAWDVPAPGSSCKLAADDFFVAAADQNSDAVLILNPATGKTLASLSPASIPGRLSPAAIAASGPWLLIADDSEKRIVRIKVRTPAAA